MPMDNTVQNVYMTTYFVIFGDKILASGGEFVKDKVRNPKSPWVDNFFPKPIQTRQFVYFNGLLVCSL